MITNRICAEKHQRMIANPNAESQMQQYPRAKAVKRDSKPTGFLCSIQDSARLPPGQLGQGLPLLLALRSPLSTKIPADAFYLSYPTAPCLHTSGQLLNRYTASKIMACGGGDRISNGKKKERYRGMGSRGKEPR